ncbi:MAG: ATP-binding protein, partial [Candidatus Rokuibacteriota bacterium]
VINDVHRRDGWAQEYRFRRADGSFAAVFDRGYVIRDGGGHPVRMIGAMQDVSGRRELEDQLRQVQKMDAVGQLAGGIAHDFNNLLTVITGRGELLRSRINAADPAHRDVALIVSTAQRASSLTHQLLAFSRRQLLQPRVLDLNAVLGGLAPMLRRLIGEDIELTLVPETDQARVKADPAQLEQIIVNLAVNARDAMPSGGRLSVKTGDLVADEAFVRQHPGAHTVPYAVLTVADTGVGMDGDMQARIFEPFFTTKEVGKGTGLGLSMVYGIVRQHNGLIAVESEPGRGSVFRIYFPRVDEPTEPLPSAAAAGEALRGTETILLVEDEIAVRELARDILLRHGYTIITAANAGEALLICEKEPQPIHLLVSDVIMPLMSGRQLAERLRPLRPAMKILFMSGYTHAMAAGRAALDPHTSFLHKPFTPDMLASKVREVLDMS